MCTHQVKECGYACTVSPSGLSRPSAAGGAPARLPSPRQPTSSHHFTQARALRRAQAPPVAEPLRPTSEDIVMSTPTKAHHRLGMKALVVDDEIALETAAGRALRGLVAELERRDIRIVTAATSSDAIAIVGSDPALQCVLLDWDLGPDGHAPAIAVLEALRARNHTVPVFLLADRSVASTVPAKVMAQVDDFVLAAGRHHRLRRAGASRRPWSATARPCSRPCSAPWSSSHGCMNILAHAGPHGRNGLPEIPARPRLLRVLRRAPAALRPLHLGG